MGGRNRNSTLCPEMGAQEEAPAIGQRGGRNIPGKLGLVWPKSQRLKPNSTLSLLVHVCPAPHIATAATSSSHLLNYLWEEALLYSQHPSFPLSLKEVAGSKERGGRSVIRNGAAAPALALIFGTLGLFSLEGRCLRATETKKYIMMQRIYRIIRGNSFSRTTLEPGNTL